MPLLGSLIIFSLVIHGIIGTDCDKSDIDNDPNGILKPEGATIPDGSSVTLQCTTAGYQPADGDGKQSQCNGGVWTQTLSTCKPAKCPKRLTSPPMDHGTYKYKNDSGADAVENGTLATVQCDKGYRLVKKTANGDYKATEFSDSDAFFCHYRVWVGRKATDLGYKCEPMGKVLLIGAQFGDGDKIMELYDTEQPGNNAPVSTELSVARFGHVSGVFDDGLVVIAGGVYTSDTEFYDPKEDKLTSFDAMSVKRGYAGSAMLDNEMIVCGGYDGSSVTHKTCERLYYDESANPIPYKWDSSFTQMNTGRYNHAMTEYKNELFVIGGHDGGVQGAINMGERYKKTTNTWVPINNMPTACYALSAAGLGDFIYACGGTAGVKLCEKYNPGTNTWDPATSMNTDNFIDCDKSDIDNDHNGILKPEGATIPDGSSITLQCTTAGYQPADGDGKQSQCNGGVWTQTLSTCKPAKCPKRLTSPPMDHGTYKYKNDSGADAVENGTLATVQCDKGYRLVKKTANGDYKAAEFIDSDAYFCHYRVWVGRKATDLGYKCEPMGKVLLIGAQHGDGNKIMELYDTKQPGNNAPVSTELSVARFGHVSGVFDDGLVVIAGGRIGVSGIYTSDTVFYDPKEDQLTSGDAMSVERGYAGSAMLDNEMIVCGGVAAGTTHETCVTERLLRNYDEM